MQGDGLLVQGECSDSGWMMVEREVISVKLMVDLREQLQKHYMVSGYPCRRMKNTSFPGSFREVSGKFQGSFRRGSSSLVSLRTLQREAWGEDEAQLQPLLLRKLSPPC